MKYGSEVLMGFMSKKVCDLAAKAGRPVESLPSKTIASTKAVNELKMMISDTFNQLCEDLVKAHKQFRNKESRSEKDKAMHGSITEQKQVELDNAKRLYERLFAVVTSLAECMNQKMPVLVEVEKDEEEGKGMSVWDGGSGGLNVISHAAGEEVGSGGLFGDAETRSFYEDLPDMLSLVPISVLGITQEQAATLKEEWEQRKNTTQSGSISGELDAPDTSSAGAGGISGGGDDNAADDGGAASTGLEADGEADAEDGTPADQSKHAKLNALLTEKLPECVNRAKVDEFCSSYCYLNTKSARKKLITSLIKVPRGRSELAATYSRIVAILSRIFPEIATQLMDALRREFYGMLKTKNQSNVENKIKNVRYQGELIKFGVAPPIVAFRMLDALMKEFTQHSVDLLAALLETCGRYLYLLSFTHEKMNDVLETMLRLRRAKNLDLRQQTILESAYFAVKPPERERSGGKDKAPRSLVQQYARFLISQKLDDPKSTVEEVIKCLRRLPWQSREVDVQQHVIKAVLKMARTKYVSLPNIADCLSGMSKHYPNLVIELVDRILEEVQRGLDSPYKREIQRLLGVVRLLGEMYNFAAVSSAQVFELLYHLINFGHDVPASVPQQAAQTTKYDPRLPAEVDPANDLFRAQLVCEILNTCGVYYVRGLMKEKLNRFLVYFQRYLLTKQFIPLHIEFAILDTFDSLEELAWEAALESQLKASSRAAKAGDSSSKADASSVVSGTIFTRFENMEDVQAVIDSYEDINAVQLSQPEKDDEDDDADEDEEDDSKGPTSSEPSSRSSRTDSQSLPDEDDFDSDEDDEDDEGSENNEEEDDEEEDAEEEEEEENEDLSEREAARMLDKMRIVEEDDEFERAFKHVMQDSLSSAPSAATSSMKSTDLSRMAIPAVLPKPKNAAAVNMCAAGATSSPAAASVAFKLLSRDAKGRVEARQLLVPQTSTMAVKLQKAEEELKIEKQRLKERVLQIESLVAEAEFEEANNQQQFFNSRGRSERTSSSSSSQGGDSVGGRSAVPAVQQAPPQQPVSTSVHSQPQGGGSRGGYGRYHRPVKMEETRKPADSLNLDEFLAESSAAEMRRMKK